MTDTLTLTLVDGVQIVVPNSLNLITPYVLLEQQDWFEDEIKFLRLLLKEGQKVIDIGANYGTYCLSMAKKVGKTGTVWAFEPASSTAKFLADSIAINGFEHIVLEQSALSNVQGTAQLSLNTNSELNALVHGDVSEVTETVPLVTLDDCLNKYAWQDIELVKIDAEGEEYNILQGGKRFFAELSPLIQYEIKAGADVHLELVNNFAELGYQSFRLVPGLNLLIPFDTNSLVDGYLLNLFCCKPDRAKQLATRGFLLNPNYNAAECLQELSQLKNHKKYVWSSTLRKLPYGVELISLWHQLPVSDNTTKVYDALAFYAISQDSFLTSAIRFAALEASFQLFDSLCKTDSSNLRLASFARVARDYGARAIAVNALQQLINTIYQSNQVILHEAFLTPCKRFDFVVPSQSIGNWAFASALEEFEQLRSFSSFYTGERKILEIIRDLGLGSDEMKQRLDLLQQRFGLTSP